MKSQRHGVLQSNNQSFWTVLVKEDFGKNKKIQHNTSVAVPVNWYMYKVDENTINNIISVYTMES